MSTLIIILIGVGVLLLGVGVGYYLRVVVALGKRKSIEIDIKQMIVSAKEEARKIVDDANLKTEKIALELKGEERKIFETKKIKLDMYHSLFNLKVLKF